jgi:hypothetical protein
LGSRLYGSLSALLGISARRQPAGHSRFLYNPYTQLAEAQAAAWLFNMTRGATRKRWDATRWVTGFLFRTALLGTCGSYAGTGLPSDRNGGVSAWIRSTTMIPTDMISTDERKWSATVHRPLGEGPSDAALDNVRGLLVSEPPVIAFIGDRRLVMPDS